MRIEAAGAAGGEPQPTLQGGRYGMQLMCCGGGLGTAAIIERLE